MGDELLARAISLHLQKRSGDAEAVYREILCREPDHPLALEGLGGLMFERGHLDQARQFFARALTGRPRSALLHGNLGEVLRLMGSKDDADRHLKLAVAIDPRSPAAWNSIGLLAHDKARYAEAESAYREALRLQPRFPPALINLANALQALDRRREAALALQAALRIEPDNPIALTNLGQVLTEIGDPGLLDLAEAHCRRALSVGPMRPHAINNLGNVLQLQGRFDEAASAFHQALARDRGLAAAHHGLGLTLLEMGRLDEAEPCFREALRIDPAHAVSWMALARLLGERGELESSCQSYRTALEIRPSLAEAYWRLALLLKARMPADEVSRMRQLLDAQDLPDDQRALAHFGLAAVLDDRGLYAEAAAHLESANRLQAAADAAGGRSYDPDSHSRYIDLMIGRFTPEFLAERRGWGVADPRPVFVLGLPRSGTTLVEQILASHPRIHGAGELKEVDRLFQSLPDRACQPDLNAFDALGQLTKDSVQTAARRYLERLESLAPASACRVVDKMPDNFRMIGFIALLWPAARVIICRRDPRDIAVSCWQNGFRSLPWSNNWESMARRFADYERLMSHWRRITPIECIEVHYESLVADIETHSRRLIEFVGLEWAEGCLDFNSTRRVVRTASQVQVRQPAHTRSIGRWRRYQAQLAPLLQFLEQYQVPIERESEAVGGEGSSRHAPRDGKSPGA